MFLLRALSTSASDREQFFANSEAFSLLIVTIHIVFQHYKKHLVHRYHVQIDLRLVILSLPLEYYPYRVKEMRTHVKS